MAVGRLGHGIGAATHERHAVGVDAADRDDSSTLAHVTGRLLHRDENTADIDGHHTVEIIQRELIKRCNHPKPRIVNEDIQATKSFHGLGDGAFHCLRVSAVRPNSQSASTFRLDARHYLIGLLLRTDVGYGDGSAVQSEPLRARRAYATRSAGVTSATSPVSFFISVLLVIVELPRLKCSAIPRWDEHELGCL